MMKMALILPMIGLSKRERTTEAQRTQREETQWRENTQK
jgi:hypothetical protein